MSKPPMGSPADTQAPCCTPMTRQRIPAPAAPALAQAFKALGDPIRLQLMSMIASAEGGEICVCDLTPAFAVSDTTVSHHLKVLREAGLIDGERRASWVYYRPRRELMRQLSALLEVEGVESIPAGAHRA